MTIKTAADVTTRAYAWVEAQSNRTGPLPKTDPQVNEAGSYIRSAKRGNISAVCQRAASKLVSKLPRPIGDQQYMDLIQVLASAMFHNTKITDVIAPGIQDPVRKFAEATKLATACVSQVRGTVPTP
jgi:hypothetical protein